jgi:hypothetical protein
MLAGMAVTLAEPSGLWGMMKEGMASGQALLDVKRDPGASELAKALVAEMETSAGRSAARDEVKADLTGKSPVEMRQQIIATLTRVGQILDANAPDDAAAFKAWLRHVAERVAEAASEGGFLGFGGVLVTDAEKASIAEVDADHIADYVASPRPRRRKVFDGIVAAPGSIALCAASPLPGPGSCTRCPAPDYWPGMHAPPPIHARERAYDNFHGIDRLAPPANLHDFSKPVFSGFHHLLRRLRS